MEQQIKKITIPYNMPLDGVVYSLLTFKENGYSVYCIFEGHQLFSDNVSMDEAYIDVYGKTKKEFDEVYKYYLRGAELIDTSLHEMWKSFVNNNYEVFNGLDFEISLDLIENYLNGANLEDLSITLNAKIEELANNPSSGDDVDKETLTRLIVYVLLRFSPFGYEFAELVFSKTNDKYIEKDIEEYEMTSSKRW